MKYFRVIAIDLHGFGKSDRPNFAFEDFESSMNFFLMPILQVIKIKDLKKILLIGHSYSGLISAHLVPFIKNRLLGVWLISPAGFTKKNFTVYEKKVMYEKYGEQYKVGPDFMKFVAYLTFDKVCLLLEFADIKI